MEGVTSPVRTVLVADDDPEMRDLIRHALLGENYNIIVATDGDEAIKMARKEHPHLILLDVEMPLTDGYHACKTLSADPEIHGVPIIMLTSRAGEEDILQGFNNGAKDYITKPFSIGTLRAKIKTWLLRSAGDQDLGK